MTPKKDAAADEPVDRLLEAARAGGLPPVVLVRGDRVLAEPAARRLAAALGGLWGVEPSETRHPGDLAAVVDDLRTYSLFGTGKLVLAIETGILADRAAAADLLAELREALPWPGGEPLAGKTRDAALRLLQALRLFDLDPAAGARSLAGLPDAALVGGRVKGGKAAAEELRAQLEPLLAAALAAGLRGIGESELTLVSDALRDGLPERHVLVLVESAAPENHPLVATLGRRGAVVDAGRLEAAARGGGVVGLDRLAEELARETGTRIRREALDELARRTLRAEDFRRGGERGAIEADSTARLAAEYRKLATGTGGRAIELQDVGAQVEDRGDQDVWAIFDAIGAGRAGEALAGLERRLDGAEDRTAARLEFFSLLAGYARQLAAIRGLARATGAYAAGRAETSYPRFKERVAPSLQGRVEGLEKNPLAGIHEFRLHRAYLAAWRFSESEAARLPALVLATELRLKGDSGDPDAALAELVVRLARPEATAPEQDRVASRATQRRVVPSRSSEG
jgi:DNA polymerase III delta subunit